GGRAAGETRLLGVEAGRAVTETQAYAERDRGKHCARDYLEVEADAAGQRDKAGAAGGQAKPHHERARRPCLQQQQSEPGRQPDDPVGHECAGAPQGEAGGTCGAGGSGGSEGGGMVGGGAPGGPPSSPRSSCMACTMPPARAELSIGTTTSRVL